MRLNMRTEAREEQTGNPESGNHPISNQKRLASLVSGCFESGCSGPNADGLARNVMHAVAHDLEMLAFAVSADGVDIADIERSLIMAYGRLRAGADLAQLLESQDGAQ
jgi:hypothetical protein